MFWIKSSLNIHRDECKFFCEAVLDIIPSFWLDVKKSKSVLCSLPQPVWGFLPYTTCKNVIVFIRDNNGTFTEPVGVTLLLPSLILYFKPSIEARASIKPPWTMSFAISDRSGCAFPSHPTTTLGKASILSHSRATTPRFVLIHTSHNTPERNPNSISV